MERIYCLVNGKPNLVGHVGDGKQWTLQRIDGMLIAIGAGRGKRRETLVERLSKPRESGCVRYAREYASEIRDYIGAMRREQTLTSSAERAATLQARMDWWQARLT